MINVYEELADSSRRQLLSAMRTGPQTVGDLVSVTGLKQPNVSNHLARMKGRGIVKGLKSGRHVYYSLATKEVEEAVASVDVSANLEQCPVDMRDLCHRYAKAAVAGDESVCQETLEVVIRSRTPLLDIYDRFLEPAMAMVGTWYGVRAIDEAQEHMASEITERMMARIVQVLPVTIRDKRIAVLGCAVGSWHVIGLRMLGDYLKLNGWQTLFMGADVPTPAFLAGVNSAGPDLVLVNCNSVESKDETLKLLKELRAHRPKNGYAIGIGGREVSLDPSAFLLAGADFSSASLREFVIETLPRLNQFRKGRGELAKDPS